MDGIGEKEGRNLADEVRVGSMKRLLVWSQQHRMDICAVILW
jgi:hypothetical protein